MILTAAQLTSIRSRPHSTKLWLSVYQPSTVLACQVDDIAITKGERAITYDGVTSGSYLLVQSGMTLWVGTVAGGYDKGMVRIRSATSTILTIAENSHINWADDDYLTVVSFFEINAVYPRIIQDPTDATKTIWYKDYDITYTNQNSVLGTFICMGSHYAGFIGNVYYTASGTLNLRGDALSYHWFFEGGTPTGSSVHTPGNITYTTPGHYTTRLIVSGSVTGAVDVSYRHVSIYDRPENGTHVPILSWELMGLNGSRDSGGYTANIRAFQTTSQFIEGSLVILFADDLYGDDLSTKHPIGGNQIDRDAIVFVGYILKDSIRYNYRDSYVDFSVASPIELMKNCEGFGVSVQDSRDPDGAPAADENIPTGWVVILDMDLRRAIYHYLRWHSTVLLCTDFEFVGTDRMLQYFDADRQSLYDSIATFMKGTFIGNIVNDRQGKVWAERDIHIEPSLYPTTFVLDKRDWMNDVEITEAPQDAVSFLEIGGVAYSGPTGTYSACLAAAPGVAPAYRGKIQRAQGLALINQTELNTIAGSAWAQSNILYPGISFELAGNYRNFDIAPQEIIPVTIAPSDNVRNITFTAKHFFVNRLDYSYDPRKETLFPKIDLCEIGSGFAGDEIPIPDTAPTEGYNVPPISIPPIYFPPFSIDLGDLATGTWGTFFGAKYHWLPFLGGEFCDGSLNYIPTSFDTKYVGIPMMEGYVTKAYARFFTGQKHTGPAEVYAVYYYPKPGEDGKAFKNSLLIAPHTVYDDNTDETKGSGAGGLVDELVPAVQGYHLSTKLIYVFCQNTMIHFQFERDALIGDDTATGDIYAMGIYIQW